MHTNSEIIHTITEATAIRLYNSVIATSEPSPSTRHFVRQMPLEDLQQNSIDSIMSNGEFKNSCRICRWNRSDMELTKCPCLCKGSVGFVHLQCLKRWIMQRRDNHCEICNTIFEVNREKLNVGRMIKAFFKHCARPIVKHLLMGVSLMPLTHIILQQVVICLEKINLSPNEQLSLKEVLLAASALMTSSAIFFHFFEFITTRFIVVRNIIRHWWIFGNASDFAQIPMEIDFLELFT